MKIKGLKIKKAKNISKVALHLKERQIWLRKLKASTLAMNMQSGWRRFQLQNGDLEADWRCPYRCIYQLSEDRQKYLLQESFLLNFLRFQKWFSQILVEVIDEF